MCIRDSREAAAQDHDLGAGDRHLEAPQQLDDAQGGARQRRGLPEHEPPQVDGVQAVDCLLYTSRCV